MNKNILRICSLIMVVSLILLSFTACKKDTGYEQNNESTTAETETTEVAPLGEGINPLTGEKTLTKEAIGKRPVAIMIENSPAARPQWGLSTPDVVVEGIVEGGITRMMWIYADTATMPSVIGPVRSARHDYVEIADGMNALYIHCGGSNIADEYMPQIGMDHVNLMVSSTGSQREPSRKAPHNLIINKDAFVNSIKSTKKLEQTKDNFAPFTFDGEVKGDKACNSVKVSFSSSYKHTFKYDEKENVYYNYMNTSEMKDGNNNKTMAVSNVIVMYSPVKQCDEKGHMDWEMSGGKALLVTNGTVQEITYKKADKRAPLKFYGVDGKLLKVNAGKTWIGVVPTGHDAEIA